MKLLLILSALGLAASKQLACPSVDEEKRDCGKAILFALVWLSLITFCAGYYGVTEHECELRDCCWIKSNVKAVFAINYVVVVVVVVVVSRFMGSHGALYANLLEKQPAQLQVETVSIAVSTSYITIQHVALGSFVLICRLSRNK